MTAPIRRSLAAPADSIQLGRHACGAEWLHVSGITPALSEEARERVTSRRQAARRNGVRVSFDCNFRSSLWGRASPASTPDPARLCELCDAHFRRRTRYRIHARIRSTMRRLRPRSPDAASQPSPSFLTTETHRLHGAGTARRRRAGTRGPVARRNAHTVTVESYPLQGIVDRIGAGDAFAAGVLHGLINGFGPPRSLDFGAASAVPETFDCRATSISSALRMWSRCFPKCRPT